jgi:hypothetical protein
LIDSRLDSRDLSVAHEHVAGSERSLGHGVHGRAAEEQRLGVRRKCERYEGAEEGG